MKIERLIGIIIILLQNKKVTAPYLAERFLVSRRTIYRDITDICLAGIPIITLPGTDGGIAIDEDYKIDKTIFTEKELQAIFSGLLSLDSVSSDHKYQNIMDKFSTQKNKVYTSNHILVNLSSHYKNSLAPKIECFQEAIEHFYKVEFDYYKEQGKRRVELEPYLVVFQWSNWYLFGYEPEKNDFRLYKMNRLWNYHITEQVFKPRQIPKNKLEFNQCLSDDILAVILFEESVAYRLIEEYGIDCYVPADNGKLRFEFGFTNQEYLLEWVLGFGNKAELLEPVELRVELKKRLENMVLKYMEY